MKRVGAIGAAFALCVDPIPEYLDHDWYRNDDMSIEYDGGGYYLHDRRHPGRPGIAISIAF